MGHSVDQSRIDSWVYSIGTRYKCRGDLRFSSLLPSPGTPSFFDSRIYTGQARTTSSLVS